jgi:hypothetical protein
LGGREQKDHGSKPAPAIVERAYLENAQHRNFKMAARGRKQKASLL